MSRKGSNTSNFGPSYGGLGPQFFAIPGMKIPPVKFGKTNSTPCLTPKGSCSPLMSPPMMAQAKPALPLNRPPVGIRLRCPSCCNPAGSCTCGCNANSASRTSYK